MQARMAKLVNLVKQDDRIIRPAPPERVHDLPRHTRDKRPPVTADLALVTHAAERDPDKLAAHRFGERARDRGLADAGRAVEEEDRGFVRRTSGGGRGRRNGGRRRSSWVADNDGGLGDGSVGDSCGRSRLRRSGRGEQRIPLLLLETQDGEPFEKALLDLVCERVSALAESL